MMSRITTVEQLRAYMETFIPAEEGIADDQLIWFVCLQEAKTISEQYSWKDLAHMLNEGLKPMDKIEDVQDWLDTYYDENMSEFEKDMAQLDIKYLVAVHVGNKDEIHRIDVQRDILDTIINDIHYNG